MATYEAFKLSSLPKNTPSDSKWHFFHRFSGKYEGAHTFAMGKGLSYYVVPAENKLETSNIFFCKEDQKFIFQSTGYGTSLVDWKDLKAAIPGWTAIDFNQVTDVWEAALKTTSDDKVQWYINKVAAYHKTQQYKDAIDQLTPTVPTIKYAWTLSSQGVSHAL